MKSPCNHSLVGRLLGQESRIIAGIPRRMIQPVLNQFSTGTDDSQTFSFNSLYVSPGRTVASGAREMEGASGDGERAGSGSSIRKGANGPLRHGPAKSFEALRRGRVRQGTTTLVDPSRVCGCIPDLGWEQSGGESVPAVAGTVYSLWARRSAGARSGRTVESVSWGGCEGRHKGEERVERSEERVSRFCLSEIGSGTDGAWFGETLSIGHLSPISTPGR